MSDSNKLLLFFVLMIVCWPLALLMLIFGDADED